MRIKYPPRKDYRTHSSQCGCNRCFKSKFGKGKKLNRNRVKRLDYFEYIASSLWYARKARYYLTHKKQCQACGTLKGIQLHHMKYGDWGFEPDYALLTLCEACHKEFHKKYDTSRNIIAISLKFIRDKQKEVGYIVGLLD